ncbi:CaiB/BaiF CoA-transferase family protein [Bradyrhizobium sp. Ai1a-2]|uniref:CaiB/BaiF CoA transferase family protein n=1 Tax=Bradyrhizobium sp. Ai1a-2 TaxID=196490 RepID=UPI00040FAD85|nr:CaiB/BaiF CoA-transferase family protein [Bradyrhizobium sp. Ai1a-2]
MPAPLEGLRVVDFTRVLAGPHCTKALRDLGADVIKIEPPSGDLGRVGLPYVTGIGLYYVQQNAGKRNLSLDLNYAEAREIVTAMCREADIIVENFRPGTLARFKLSYDDIRVYNPRIIYVSLSGYGQSTSWRNRPAFAPTVQAETGLTAIVQDHFGEALTEARGDACSHADVYTGLQGVIAVLAALQDRNRTGEGQHVDVSMAATMLSVNERAGALLSGIDTDGEPIALSANESHIFEMADGTRLTIAGSPIYSPMFQRYCAMMRRNDLLEDPRYATAQSRRRNLAPLLAEIRAWLGTFDSLEQLQAQVSEAGLAVGRVRTTEEFSASDWVKEWNAVVSVDDRAGGSVRMPGNPWIFSRSKLPPAGAPAFQGEHNEEILTERGVPADQIAEMKARKVLLSRRTAFSAFED